MRAPKILVFQHGDEGGLAALEPLFHEAGVELSITRFDREPEARPGLAGYDGLVVLGGAESVLDSKRVPHLRFELDAIGEAVSRKTPVLAICLGAQLAAKALGAKTFKSPRPEVGWCSLQLTPSGVNDPFFKNFRSEMNVMQWHEDAFDFPPGAVPLASSPVCAQAYRYKDALLAAQFHWELDEKTIRRWTSGADDLSEEGKKALLDQTPRELTRARPFVEGAFAAYRELIRPGTDKHKDAP